MKNRALLFCFALRALARKVIVTILPLWMFHVGYAQTCGGQWLPGQGERGVNGVVNATVMWDSDGAGPSPPRLVVAGDFTVAGSTFARSIAVYDAESRGFTPLGTGVDGTVFALAVLPTGELVAGGSFVLAGGATAQGVAKWNGTAWSQIGSGLRGTVRCFTLSATGDLVAGGSFGTSGTTTLNNISRWNGSSWAPLGSGFNSMVLALTTLPSGDLVAGGSFSSSGTTPLNRIARWSGSSWTGLGSGTNQPVWSLAVLTDGSLAVGGSFSTAGGMPANLVARWREGLGEAGTWSPLGGGLLASTSGTGVVRAMLSLPDGGLIVGGGFLIPGVPSGAQANANFARLNGASWAPVGPSVDSINTLTMAPNADIYVGGSMRRAGDQSVRSIARWDGSAISALTDGIDRSFRAMTLDDSGSLLVAGNLWREAGNVVQVARWDGEGFAAYNWTPIGGTFNGLVAALAVTPNGVIYAGGNFLSVGGVSANYIARFSTSGWIGLGTGTNSFVFAIAPLADNAVALGGDFTFAGPRLAPRVAWWNGAFWFPYATGVSAPSAVEYVPGVYSVTRVQGQNIVVGGMFTQAGTSPANNIAMWNGSSWQPLGPGLTSDNVDVQPYVGDTLVLPGGDIIAGGEFSRAGDVPVQNIARWNGSNWSALGGGLNGPVTSMAVMPNGHVIAAGSFTTAGSVAARHIARWDGSQWHPLGSGTDQPVVRVRVTHRGDVIAIGNFTTAGGLISSQIARYTWNGLPGIASQPVVTGAFVGQTLRLRVELAPSATGGTLRWLRNDADLSDGAGGASAGGGSVAGAVTAVPPQATAPVELVISNPAVGDSGRYVAVYANACGAVRTSGVSVVITIEPCNPSDVAGATNPPGPDGTLTADDIIVFLGWFFSGDTRSNIAGPNQSTTPDANFTADDIIIFLGRYFAGC